LEFNCGYEAKFPWPKRRGGVSEYSCVFLFPDFPCCNQEDLHEEIMAALAPCLLDGFKERYIMVPGYPKEVPASHTEGALEEQVTTAPLCLDCTKHSYSHLLLFCTFSPEQVSWIQSASEHEPYDNNNNHVF
jgi:hypothetical protein